MNKQPVPLRDGNLRRQIQEGKSDICCAEKQMQIPNLPQRTLKSQTGETILSGPQLESPFPRIRLSTSQMVRAGIQSVGNFCLRSGPLTLAGSVFSIEVFREPRQMDALWALGQCLLICLVILAAGMFLAGAKEGLRVIATELELTPNHLIIREGLIFQREHTLPRKKIVEVEISQDLIAVVLSLADVQIATGQSRYSDGIRISGLEFRDALALEKFLLGRSSEKSAQEESEQRKRAWG